MHIPQVWCDGKSSFCVVPKFGFWCKLNMALGLADSVLLATSGSSSIRKILFSYSFSDPLSLLSFSYFYSFPLLYILCLPVFNHLYVHHLYFKLAQNIFLFSWTLNIFLVKRQTFVMTLQNKLSWTRNNFLSWNGAFLSQI